MRRLAILVTALGLASLTAVASAADGDRVERTGAKASKSSKATTPKPRLSDGQIKKILIRESIASYSGNCPCPYNTASNGSSCGGRSAWSRAGGEEPLCYPKDVSAEMVREYRASHAEGQKEPEAGAVDDRTNPSGATSDNPSSPGTESGTNSSSRTASR
jgi:hypothetical protein